MNLFEYICSFVFPEDCLGCGVGGGLLCENCRDKNRSPPLVQSSAGHLDKIVSFFSYRGVPKKLIKKFKYSFSLRAFRELRGLLEWSNFLECNCIVPIPISSTRIRKRGFNQSEILARHFSKMTGVPMVKALTVRVHNVQASMNRIEREKNVMGIFGINGCAAGYFDGRSIALVDDVATTCSTLQECARILKKNGAKRVTGIVLARGW